MLRNFVPLKTKYLSNISVLNIFTTANNGALGSRFYLLQSNSNESCSKCFIEGFLLKLTVSIESKLNA